jgi:RHS repeat-associated protein
LNRVTARNYSDDTPDVAYFYDSQPLPAGAPQLDRGSSAGKMVAVTYGGRLGNYAGQYDRLGRTHLSRQVTGVGAGGVQAYDFTYDYYPDGILKSQTYPSGKIVETKYDAAGRLAGVKNQGGLYYAGGDPAVPNNPGVIKYTVHGAVAAMRLGNGLWEHSNFNSNMQVTQIGLGTSATDSSKLQLDYTYGTDDSHNNGNVYTQSIRVPWLTQPYVQTYGYDKLNRLSSAQENNSAVGTADTWKQVYSYDRYGNRTLAAGTSYPAQLNDTNNPSVGAADNRIVSAEYSYDNAGNLLCDPDHRCVQSGSSLTPYYEYDAENRMKAAGATSVDGGAAYIYDGDGHRVKKVKGAVTTVYVYDAAGQLVAEYGGESSQTSGVSYITHDSQGSTRVITGQNQNEVRGRYDYLPFGEEVYAGRTGYGGNNNVRQRFTGKEHDAETGLDYFGARYYAATAGRFTGVDPSQASVKLSDPQSWNRYTYAMNNPLEYLDTNGKWPTRIHDWIVDHALPKLSGHERGIIKAASKAVDYAKGTMSNENAYKHGLRKSDETLEQAADKSDKWIKDHINSAVGCRSGRPRRSGLRASRYSPSPARDGKREAFLQRDPNSLDSAIELLNL